MSTLEAAPKAEKGRNDNIIQVDLMKRMMEGKLDDAKAASWIQKHAKAVREIFDSDHELHGQLSQTQDTDYEAALAELEYRLTDEHEGK